MIAFPSNDKVRAALVSAGTVEELIETLLNSIPANISGPFAAVLLLNEDGDAFSQLLPSGWDPEYAAVLKGARIASGRTTSSKAVLENAPVYVTHIGYDEHDWDDMPSRWWGMLANWTAPLCTSGGRAFGALSLYFSVPKSAVLLEKESFEDFARCLASAIESYSR